MEKAVFEKVGKMVKAEIINNFEEIATEAGKHKLCDASEMAFETLAKRIANPDKWRIGELRKLSMLLGVENKILLEMADRLGAEKKKGKK